MSVTLKITKDKMTVTPEMVEAARKVFVMRAAEKATRAKVLPVYKNFLNSLHYDGQKWLEPFDRTYQLPAEDAQKYYADIEEYRAANYPQLKTGFCPILVAKHERLMAEKDLVRIAADVVYSGTDPEDWAYDIYREFLELQLRFLVRFI